ncbi:phosphoribosyltransferase domain-containing protein [Psychromonas sp. SP041]|uniref:phosphoribosyltransferase domain-containing protein n=1 Tax=Psychromonas sp. SP041 TaxID=1365007 RepID=UPI000420371E|nr:phosphoribosyltransferase domain-containing protein [Psychromonas sp. SP041]
MQYLKHIYDIKAGTLLLQSNEHRKTLDNIVAFACRENPKRHFILINKLIGRYTPTAPSVMRATYNQLAERVGYDSDCYVVSFAEAATGLGAGVADSLARDQDNEIYFQHTTRHKLDEELWFTVDEEHSHAVNHMFYKPTPDLYDAIIKSKKLVIIDDEITTGRTIKVFLLQILPYLTDLEEIVITSIVDLMATENHLKDLDIDIPIRYISLVKANITLEKDPDFNPTLPNKVNSGLDLSDSISSAGRCAIRMPYREKLNAISSTKNTLVIADGEHQYIPFLLAEQLEKSGVEVAFQSINRSPILVCDEIVNKYNITANTDGAEHYLYNFFPQNKSVFVISENEYEGLLFTNEVRYHEWRC